MSDEDLTVFVGNLHEKVSEEILFELFLQAGPLVGVRIPSSNGVQKKYGFVQFKHEISVPYALYLLDGTPLFDKPIKLNSRSGSLDLYRPPRRMDCPEPMNYSSIMRPLGAVSKTGFDNITMLPSGPSHKAIQIRDNYLSNDTSSLRMLGGSKGRRFMDKSMLPSTIKSHSRRDDSPPRNSWSPRYYPSQSDNTMGYERGTNDAPREKYRHDRGISNHLNKPHQKTPYYNERHHNRDKKRFDSYPSQRSRQRPFTH